MTISTPTFAFVAPRELPETTDPKTVYIKDEDAI